MAGMTDLYLSNLARLYEVGEILKHWCEDVSPDTPQCALMADIDCEQCPLYGLGDKLMKESGCASATGLELAGSGASADG